MKIYTKKGDQGTTQLLGSPFEIYKHTPQIEICGTIDELNSHIGLAMSHDIGTWTWLQHICHDLFHLGAEMASVVHADYLQKNVSTVTKERIEAMEKEIDRLDEYLSELKNFIMPTGCPMAAQLFVARSVARRLERRLVEYQKEVCEPSGQKLRPEILQYVNRLSDFLFVQARHVNKLRGMPARAPRVINWKPTKKDK